MSDRTGSPAMKAEELLEQAAGVVARRRSTYGQPIDLFEQVAKRWSFVLGVEVTAAQAFLSPEGREASARSGAPRQHHRYRGLRRLPGGGDSVTSPAGFRSCLARTHGRTAPTEDLLAMRRAAWRKQGVVMLRPEEVRDDWTRQALINEANRLYGRRAGGE